MKMSTWLMILLELSIVQVIKVAELSGARLFQNL